MGHKINVVFLKGLWCMEGISEITETFWRNILIHFLSCLWFFLYSCDGQKSLLPSRRNAATCRYFRQQLKISFLRRICESYGHNANSNPCVVKYSWEFTIPKNCFNLNCPGSLCRLEMHNDSLYHCLKSVSETPKQTIAMKEKISDEESNEVEKSDLTSILGASAFS